MSNTKIVELAHRAALQGLLAEAAHLIKLAITKRGWKFHGSLPYARFLTTEPGAAVLAILEASWR